MTWPPSTRPRSSTRSWPARRARPGASAVRASGPDFPWTQLLSRQPAETLPPPVKMNRCWFVPLWPGCSAAAAEMRFTHCRLPFGLSANFRSFSGLKCGSIRYDAAGRPPPMSSPERTAKDAQRLSMIPLGARAGTQRDCGRRQRPPGSTPPGLTPATRVSRESWPDAKKRVRNINTSGFTLPIHSGTTPETPTAESTWQESERVVV